MGYRHQSDLYLEDNISKYPAIELLCKLGYTYEYLRAGSHGKMPAAGRKEN